MFNKTKRNIVFTVVFSLMALMVVTLGTIYVSNRVSMQHENEEMLGMYVDRYDLDEQPPVQNGEKPSERPGEKTNDQGKPDDQAGKPGPRDNE
ncbi:MAG: hypothetical protein IJL81_00275, partial [Clostridia bacterium]|nr:hypothetical protein [Clostridia bacterium]